MSQAIRVGFAGAGWPAHRHAEGYRSCGGYALEAVADLIPARRAAMSKQFGVRREASDASELTADAGIDLISLCLPTHLHVPVALAALKGRKHVLCETPPALDGSQARKLAAASQKSGKVLLYANQRLFGAAEQAAQQAVGKGYIGEPYHVRVSWMRTRGVPAGTGWYTDRARSGGGALLDLGWSLLDLAWRLLGRPEPQSLYFVSTDRLMPPQARGVPALPGPADQEEGNEAKPACESAAFGLIRFAKDKSIEINASWAINQPPRHQGTVCRVHATDGAIDLYTPNGALLYRKFGSKGEAKEAPLKLPKIIHYGSMMRHLRRCIAGAEQPICGATDGLIITQWMDAAYRSAASGKSVSL